MGRPRLRRTVFHVPPGWGPVDPEWVPPRGWRPPLQLPPAPDGWRFTNRQLTGLGKTAVAGLVVVIVALSALAWMGRRIGAYERTRTAVVAQYATQYRSCLAHAGDTRPTCQDEVYGRCTNDDFWLRRPPFSSITLDDPLSDASSMCEVWLPDGAPSTGH